MINAWVIERKPKKNAIFLRVKGRNSKVATSIWLVIKPDLDLIAFHIFMRFGEDPMTNA